MKFNENQKAMLDINMSKIEEKLREFAKEDLVESVCVDVDNPSYDITLGLSKQKAVLSIGYNTYDIYTDEPTTINKKVHYVGKYYLIADWHNVKKRIENEIDKQLSPFRLNI